MATAIIISPDKLFHDIKEINSSLLSVTESTAEPFNSEGTGDWLARQSTIIYGSNSSLLGKPDKWALLEVKDKAGIKKQIIIPLYKPTDNKLNSTLFKSL